MLVVSDDVDEANGLELLFAIGLSVLLVGVCVLLVRRWREGGRVQRRALAPVLAVGYLAEVWKPVEATRTRRPVDHSRRARTRAKNWIAVARLTDRF